MKATGKVLVVDDEPNIRNGLQAVIRSDGHVVQVAGDMTEALACLEGFSCDVAVVDICMPGQTGIELLGVIRERWPYVSVVILTGQGTLETAISAVRGGAMDYLLKPAAPAVIRRTVQKALAKSRQRQEQARLLDALREGLHRLEMLPADGEEVERREKRPYFGNHIQVGDIHIDLAAHEVQVGGQQISLSPSEYRLLVTLANHVNQVLDYVTLVAEVLQYDAEPWEARELIKRHIFTLRQKIEPDPAHPRYIHNIRGIGYRLSLPV
ncbi:MAG: DNA-binding response regulator [Chloroflexi bacterium]|nr:MAG: DNA-binding response regulator [Chloroflexota bacterium]